MVRKLIPSLELTYEKLKRALLNEAVFVTGPHSSGKTYMVKKAFEEDYAEIYVSAYIDCYSVGSANRLYETICQSFTSTIDIDQETRAKKRLPEIGEPVNLPDVPKLMNKYHRLAVKKGFETLFVIFDHVEVFNQTNLLDAFVSLCRAISQKLVPIRLVIISYEDPTDIIHTIVQKSAPVAVSLQDRMQVVSCSVWSKEDVASWILEQPPDSETMRELYIKFVKNVVTLVYTADGKVPIRVKQYCQSNFAKFLKYYKNKVKEHIRKSYNSEESIEDELLDEYGLGAHMETAVIQSFVNSYMPIQDKKKRRKVWTSNCPELRLNLNTAAMIVAAYVAAYTKPADDKWNFGGNLKRKPKSRGAPSHEDCANRPFTLERLMQIYIRLMQESVGERKLNIIFNNDSSLGDVERLQNVNILQHQSGWDISSEARYKLSPGVKRDYVQRLAEHVQLDLNWYRGL